MYESHDLNGVYNSIIALYGMKCDNLMIEFTNKDHIRLKPLLYLSTTNSQHRKKPTKETEKYNIF